MARAAALVALAALLAGPAAVAAVSGVAGAVPLGVAVTAPPAVGTGQGPLSVWSGVYTTEQADRGAPLYEAECGECHGLSLEGGETAPALAGADFRWAWNGLFERLRVSMPEGRPRALTRAQKVDVLAYMLRENAFPAGDTELPSRGSRLDAITFEALQP